MIQTKAAAKVTLHVGEGVGEGIMLMYRCALFIKYCRGDVVARVPSVPTNVERESLKRCLMWLECLACVQTSAPPPPSGKIRRGVSSPDFFWGGGTSVHRVLSVLLVLSYSERFFFEYFGFPFPQKSPFQISIRFAMESEESLRKCVGLIILLIY